MTDVVMVPLDGSSFAEAALPQAVSMAARMDGVLHLVRVRQYRTVRNGMLLEAVEEEPDTLRAYLRRVEERARQIFSGPIALDVLDGPVVETLHEFATLHRVALLVMSSHGRQGLARMRLGSIADGLLHRVRLPMLVVRPESAGESDARITPVAPGCREVLVALDGSPLALRMLPIAERLAQAWCVPIRLVTVVQPPLQNYLPGVEYLGPIIVDPAHVQAVKASAEAALEPLVLQLRLRGATASAHVEVSESPVDGLCDVAERTPGAVLALTTHGDSGFRRFVRGSVADRLLHRCPVPLLLWRPASIEAEPILEREPALSLA